MSTTVASNPLGSESVTKLMLKFSIPSIISMLVGALYNIVDQLSSGKPLVCSATLPRMLPFRFPHPVDSFSVRFSQTPVNNLCPSDDLSLSSHPSVLT